MKTLFTSTQSSTINRMFFLVGFFLIALLSSSLPAQAQYFGRNKVNYKEFDFKVLQTPNFDIYHYLNNTATRVPSGLIDGTMFNSPAFFL